MFLEKTIAAVIPCMNEETQIAKVITTMPAFVDKIVVIDDKSTDNTVAVIKELEIKEPRVELICHEVNQGVGGAIASGYKWTRDHDFDVAVVMAGDGQMEPKDLPSILTPVCEGRCDYSKANRLFSGKAYQEIPKIRYFGNSILSFLTKIASGYWHVVDSQSGYTAINKIALKTIDWDKMYKRYGQPNDLLVKLNAASFRVHDVKIDPTYNVGEKSGIKIRKVVFSISWLLLKLFFWRIKEKYIIRDFHPLVLFYLLGFSLMFISFLLTGRLFYLWYQQGHAPELTSLAVMFSFSTGLQSMLFAMWFDKEYNNDLK
jgi:glycosyltransferase involved in cell wall biosynthesis